MSKPLADWLAERNWQTTQLADAARMERRVIEAILAGNYTTSPQQRVKIAAALEVPVEEISFGSVGEVDHMYGHGPQFGRSP